MPAVIQHTATHNCQGDEGPSIGGLTQWVTEILPIIAIIKLLLVAGELLSSDPMHQCRSCVSADRAGCQSNWEALFTACSDTPHTSKRSLPQTHATPPLQGNHNHKPTLRSSHTWSQLQTSTDVPPGQQAHVHTEPAAACPSTSCNPAHLPALPPGRGTRCTVVGFS